MGSGPFGGRSCGRGCDFVLGENLASWSEMEELGDWAGVFFDEHWVNRGADRGAMAHRIRTGQLVMGGEEDWFKARRSCAQAGMVPRLRPF